MPEQKRPQVPSRFARLSGIGLQMGLTIFLFASFGKYLDQDTTGKKLWTIGLTLFGVSISLYNVLRQVNKINTEDE